MTLDSGTPLRITAVISALRSGGAERVLVGLANEWVARGRHVTIVHYAPADEEPFYPLDGRVDERRLDLVARSRSPLEAVRFNLRRIRSLRREIRASRPDVVLAFTTHINVLVLLATVGTGIPVVASERNAATGNEISRPWRLLRRALYRRAGAVTALTEPSLRALGLPLDRAFVIPNPVATPPAGRSAATENLVVSVGRLAPVKGFDMLLDAFARVAPRHPEWRLEIWGEGGERARLEAQRIEHGLAAQVDLPGQTGDVPGVLGRAALYVCSSRSEGFPNAVLEAMANGLPVVTFDCPFGPREIVREGVDGLIVPPNDVAALAAAIERLIVGDDLRRRLAERAPDVVDRFSLDRVLRDYDRVFGVAMAKRGAAPRLAPEGRDGR